MQPEILNLKYNKIQIILKVLNLKTTTSNDHAAFILGISNRTFSVYKNMYQIRKDPLTKKYYSISDLANPKNYKPCPPTLPDALNEADRSVK